MDDKSSQPPRKGAWWFIWIFSTVLLPGIAPFFRGQMLLAVSVTGLVLHLIASIKLDMPQFWQSALLFWGGWLLMLVSFFVGCVSALE